MNMKNVVDIGQNIEIEVNVDDNSSITLKSTIIDIVNLNTLAIASPIHKGNVYPIQENINIKIIFYKKNTGKFYFIGEVIKREVKNKLHILYVRCNSKIRRNQRREFYRLNVLLNIEISLLSSDMESTISCMTKDISGGGTRVICKEKIPLNSLVKCYIPIDGDNIITSIGKVVRSNSVPDSMLKYDIGIEFTQIDEASRSKLISFIFEKQRKLIKKGLI